MDAVAELAERWRAEIEHMKKSIPRWEDGEMRFFHNGVDVSEEHIATLRRHIRNLEDALPILEARTLT